MQVWGEGVRKRRVRAHARSLPCSFAQPKRPPCAPSGLGGENGVNKVPRMRFIFFSLSLDDRIATPSCPPP